MHKGKKGFKITPCNDAKSTSTLDYSYFFPVNSGIPRHRVLNYLFSMMAKFIGTPRRKLRMDTFTYS